MSKLTIGFESTARFFLIVKIETMTKTIYKYQLEITDKQVVRLPIGSEILSVQMQNRQLYLWALVDPHEEHEDRHIVIFGTGDSLGYDFGVPNKYISTFITEIEQFVFHVFENQLQRPLRS